MQSRCRVDAGQVQGTYSGRKLGLLWASSQAIVGYLQAQGRCRASAGHINWQIKWDYWGPVQQHWLGTCRSRACSSALRLRRFAAAAASVTSIGGKLLPLPPLAPMPPPPPPPGIGEGTMGRGGREEGAGMPGCAGGRCCTACRTADICVGGEGQVGRGEGMWFEALKQTHEVLCVLPGRQTSVRANGVGEEKVGEWGTSEALKKPHEVLIQHLCVCV